MQRNIARYNTAYACGFENQYDTFRRTKARRIRAARQKVEKDRERGLLALEDALKLTFVYSPLTAPINYGKCLKFDKDVSFIPNTLQLETQRCFLHRKDMMKIGDYTTVGFITWIDNVSELVPDPLVKVSSTPLALYRLSELKPAVPPAKAESPMTLKTELDLLIHEHEVVKKLAFDNMKKMKGSDMYPWYEATWNNMLLFIHKLEDLKLKYTK
jgi:hypothetical protein